jgi:hypothetical protein
MLLSEAPEPKQNGHSLRRALRRLTHGAIAPLLFSAWILGALTAELRTAFNAMMQDSQLLAEVATQGLDIDPVSGAEIAALVDRLYGTPADVLDLVRKINASR